MVVLILLSVSAIYIAVAVLIAFGIYKLTKLKSVAALLLLLIVVAPVHEGIFGYPEFKRFDVEHPGVACDQAHKTDGILVEGRRALTPTDARNADSLPASFRFKELPREMVETMTPKPAQPLKSFVQFYLTTQDDPACTEHFDSVAGQPNCVGVTSSDLPRSQFAVFQEPDRRRTDADLQLNNSKMFPLVGSHTRIRDVRTNQTIAEHWDFALRSKLLPWYPWFAKSNPSSGIEAAVCVSASESF